MGSPTKQCSKCKESKPLSEFHRYRKSRDGLQPRCKPCNRLSAARWNIANKDKHTTHSRNWNLRRYGLTPDGYAKMFEEQGGRCGLCGRTPDEAGHRGNFEHILCVDHCHATGSIRKLLCSPCNKGLGIFGEDIPRLKAAIAYLEEHQSKNDNDNSHA